MISANARVLIADDHAVVRAGLRQMLAEDTAVGEIGEASTGQQTLERLRESNWELLILDIGMPDRSGMDILRHVRSGYPDTRVLILSGFPERQYAINMLRAGAHGFLGKESAPDDLLKAVHVILAGRRYLSPTMSELLITEIDNGGADRPIHQQLSKREFQIFCKLASGSSVSEIARELVPLGQDGQHLPQPRAREDALQDQRRHHLLRPSQRPDPVATVP